jgi:hypothetical protein
MSLDQTKLENLKDKGDKKTAQCPACAEVGADSKGDHLAIFPDGKYCCVAHPDDRAHSKKIYKLVGLSDSEPGPILIPIRRPTWATRKPRTLLVIHSLATPTSLKLSSTQGEQVAVEPPPVPGTSTASVVPQDSIGDGSSEKMIASEGLKPKWHKLILAPGRLMMMLKDGPDVLRQIEYLKKRYAEEGSAFLATDWKSAFNAI